MGAAVEEKMRIMRAQMGKPKVRNRHLWTCPVCGQEFVSYHAAGREYRDRAILRHTYVGHALSIAEVGAMFNRDPITIRRALRANGISSWQHTSSARLDLTDFILIGVDN